MPEPNFAEEPCTYVYQVVLAGNQALRNQKVPIDLDSDFMWTGIHGTQTGSYSVNVKLPSGRMLCNNMVSNGNLIGTANQPTAIGPSPIYQAGGIGPALDITDTSGAGNTIEICFSGIRRFLVTPQ